jgi:hypothetical protein
VTAPFTDPDFGLTAQISLGSCYYRGGNPGKLLEIQSAIAPGDFESAFQSYHAAGVEARRLAKAAADKRHNVSAREAWLWAAGYFSGALRLVDGTAAPDRGLMLVGSCGAVFTAGPSSWKFLTIVAD